MDKPIPEAVVGRAHLQAVLNLSEAARCLGVAQAKNDQGAIDYWTDKTNEYEAALTAAQQQGQAVACCTMVDYFNARACDACSKRVESFALKRIAGPHPRARPWGRRGWPERIRDLLASLPVDCLGSGTGANGQPYPIRDEVIHGITKALAQQPAAAGEESSKGADVARPKRRPYNASGSLSEYGVFPECDAQQPADDEVVFIDGVGAGRSSIKSCRDGVQWIMVGDRVYWPLSDSDAKRLQSACCGNGSFDGPAAAHATAPLQAEIEALRAEVEEWKDAARCASEQQDSLFREARALNERADKLAEALREARDAIEEWAGYASDYFREKHDLAGDLAKIDALLRDQEEGHEQ